MLRLQAAISDVFLALCKQLLTRNTYNHSLVANSSFHSAQRKGDRRRPSVVDTLSVMSIYNKRNNWEWAHRAGVFLFIFFFLFSSVTVDNFSRAPAQILRMSMCLWDWLFTFQAITIICFEGRLRSVVDQCQSLFCFLNCCWAVMLF